MRVPPPTWCPECRMQRRMVFYAERTLYKRACDMCKKGIISMYHENAPFPVYCMKCWWSDAWDGLEYGKDYDPNRTFLEQLRELMKRTPHVSLSLDYTTMENTEYANYAGHLKNCYLVFMADYSENVLYSEMFHHTKDCLDSLMFSYCELSSELIDCGRCYRAFYSEDCDSCHEIAFCKNCTGCSNCFGCVNLRNKQYHFFNEPCTKDDYFTRIKRYDLSRRSVVEAAIKEAEKFWVKFPVKFTHSLRNFNSTGEYVFDSKNVKDSFIVLNTEDSRYSQEISMGPVRDAYDYTQWGNNAERIIECVSVGEGASDVRYSLHAWPNVRDVEYCMWTLSSAHMFGCVNIRKKEFCILNKQYAPEEFHKLKQEIIAGMKKRPYIDALGRKYYYGEYFPSEFSPFAYNESLAHRYLSLTGDEAKSQGFTWCSYDRKAFNITMKGSAVPDDVSEIKEDILKEVIECMDCGRAYRIAPSECSLLQRLGLALPSKCHDCRHKRRTQRMSKYELNASTCQCAGKTSKNGLYVNQGSHSHGINHECRNEFRTSVFPNEPTIVYCESCYQSEIN